MRKFNVALDGPSGAGKSSAADLLGQRLHLHHLDTGAMYRAIAYGLDELGIAPQSSPELEKALNQLELHFQGKNIFLNGKDVSTEIRTPRMSKLASLYSALPEVRKHLVAQQQKITAEKGYIVDGRDICDVVLPDAEVKIYLDASVEARANRRFLQDSQSGKPVVYEDVYADIEARDLQDRTRKVSPLRISKDAVVIDSSNMSLEQTVDAMETLIQQSLGEEK